MELSVLIVMVELQQFKMQFTFYIGCCKDKVGDYLNNMKPTATLVFL